MAIDIFSIDQLYPTFTGNETNSEKIDRLNEFIFKLIESLRYTLYHLDSKNFTSGTVDKFKQSIEKDFPQTDLSDYVKQEDLQDYVTDTELGTELQDYVTDTELGTTLQGYATTSDIPDVSNFVTQNDLSGYATQSDLSNYATTSDLNSRVPKASSSDTEIASDTKLTLQGAGATIVLTNTDVQITALNGIWLNGVKIH